MSILEEPTNEYSMRHAANLLSNLARANEGNLSPSDLEVINFAYQQLHRGANALRSGAQATPQIRTGEHGEAEYWEEEGKRWVPVITPDQTKRLESNLKAIAEELANPLTPKKDNGDA